MKHDVFAISHQDDDIVIIMAQTSRHVEDLVAFMMYMESQGYNKNAQLDYNPTYGSFQITIHGFDQTILQRLYEVIRQMGKVIKYYRTNPIFEDRCRHIRSMLKL